MPFIGKILYLRVVMADHDLFICILYIIEGCQLITVNHVLFTEVLLIMNITRLSNSLLVDLFKIFV